MLRPAGVVGLLLLAACAQAAPDPGGQLPPADEEEIIREVDPLVGDLGFRTARAGLYHAESYEVSPTGRHLALYVEPLEEISPARYLETLPQLAATLTAVFDRWPQLASFDVCQEPFEATSATPPPVTRINVPRPDAEAVTAARTDLGNLLRAADERNERNDPRGLFVEVFGDAARHPLYRRALAEAGA